MKRQLDRIAGRIGDLLGGGEETARESLAPIRLATAQLLLATAAEVLAAEIGQVRSGRRPGFLPVVWAPVVLAPLAAAAQVRHALRPVDETSAALRILNAATLIAGGVGAVSDLFGPAPRRRQGLGPLGIASAGLLGLLLDQHERRIVEEERDLRRRAKVVERLVPARKPRLDRVVIHV